MSINIVFAQEITLKTKVDFPNADKISVDRYGNIYVSDTKGNIQRFDKNGKKESVFSPQKLAKISLLESWNTIKTFVFYKDLQEFVLIDRFMSGTINTKFDANSVGFARCATLANDNTIWVIDEVDFSLKKIDLQTNKVLYNNQLQLVLPNEEYDITFMREYQNTLFVEDKNNGLIIFDNLGNYKKKLPIKGLDFFGFYDNDLYYISGNKLVLINLYSFEENTINLPIDNCKLAILFEDKLILVEKNIVNFYEILLK